MFITKQKYKGNSMNKEKFPKEYKNLLSMETILDNTEDSFRLKIILKYDNIKGTSVYANKPIRKGETVAYYKITVFDNEDYVSPTNFLYAVKVYTKTDKPSKYLIGDISLDSIQQPINNVPFWGFLVNEPSVNQDVNCELDSNLEKNYTQQNRLRPKQGCKLIYKLISTRNIDVGEEITLYYGDNYKRDYEINIQ